MLPHKKTHAQEPSGSRRGFEVRVIGGGTPAAAGVGPIAERGIEVGVVIGGGTSRENPAWDDDYDDAPVQRLEAEFEDNEPLKAKAMSEAGPAVPRVGSRQKQERIQRMTLWMSLGAVVITVAAVGGVLAWTRSAAPVEQTAETAVPAPVPEAAETEAAYFVDHADSLMKEAEGILFKYATAKSVEQVLPLIRDASEVEGMLRQHWQPWNETDFLRTGELNPSVVLEGLRPVVAITGSKRDYSKFEAIFVREKGKLLLDWAATEGMGDLQVSQLAEGIPAKDATVRVTLQPSDFYTPDMPEGQFRCYKVNDAANAYLAWAYVSVDSPMIGTLKDAFNEGSVLMEKNSRLHFTLKLDGPCRPGSNQYLVTEMLHKGWVSP